MRTIGVVTVGRSDYGICLPLLRRIQSDPHLRLVLIVGGAHLSPEHGMTVRAIEADGFEIAERVEMTPSSAEDSPKGIARAMGRGAMGFARALESIRPDILVVLGDRYEMHSAALAALPFKIPVAHIHGGEATRGAFDDALRHSITKLSHLHFVAAEEYARRVIQLGEEPWRVRVCGAPALDNLRSLELLGPDELESRFGVTAGRPPLLVTFHPVTLEYERTEWQVGELLSALEGSGLPIVFTAPNADTRGSVVTRLIGSFVATHSSARLVDNLGTQAYFSLMANAVAMVGNSSSGIIEAPSFRLPVVNIGSRQDGRIKPENVIDFGYSSAEISEGISRAISHEFRDSLRDLVNPYDLGGAAEIVVDSLSSVDLLDGLVQKRFYDLEVPAPAGVSAGVGS